MELHNPNGLIIIWFTSFANKWYANTGTVIHFLGLYDGQFYLTEKDKKLIKKYTIK